VATPEIPGASYETCFRVWVPCFGFREASSSASAGLAGYADVDMLGLWYQFVNFEAKEGLDPDHCDTRCVVRDLFSEFGCFSLSPRFDHIPLCLGACGEPRARNLLSLCLSLSPRSGSGTMQSSVRVHSLVDRPCATKFRIPFFR
jgi:hypothetical protein